MKDQFKIFFVAIMVSGFWSSVAKAAPLVSSVDLNTGFTALNIKAPGFEKTLSSISSMEFNYSLKHAAFSTSYTMSFFQIVQADGKTLPYTRFSLGGRWYISGHNGERVVMDQGVEGRLWKATPFIGMYVGIANLSMKGLDNNPDSSLNASMFDLSPRFGAEIPLTPSLFLTAQLVIHSGMSMAASEDKSISYSGMAALGGLIYSGF